VDRLEIGQGKYRNIQGCDWLEERTFLEAHPLTHSSHTRPRYSPHSAQSSTRFKMIDSLVAVSALEDIHHESSPYRLMPIEIFSFALLFTLYSLLVPNCGCAFKKLTIEGLYRFTSLRSHSSLLNPTLLYRIRRLETKLSLGETWKKRTTSVLQVRPYQTLHN
jgi:hypothetical protein